MPSVCVPVLSPVLLLSPVTVLPCQLGAESDRAPCPAPFTCHCHLSTHNISRFFSSPMQEALPSPSRITLTDPFWAFSIWSAPLHTCTIVFVCLSCMPPHLVPCSLTSHFFFFAIPHLTVPLLGSVGGFNHCFWVSLGLPCEGPTPLSSSPYPSITSPPTKPCLSCLAPSSSITFQKKIPPFRNPQPLSLAPFV